MGSKEGGAEKSVSSTHYPTWAQDLLTNQRITRRYSPFGEIKVETSSRGSLFWEYDELGRPLSFTLPDSSSITWKYLYGHLYQVTRKDANHIPCYAHTYLKMDPNNHVEEEQLIYNLGRIHTSHDLLERPSLQTSKWNTHEVSYDPLGRVDLIKSSLFTEKHLAYDPLNQLRKEGDKDYLFDSIGNLAIYETNDCNEVLSSPESILDYDGDGNLKERNFTDQKILYSYDALGRLVSIIYPGHKKVIYSYDPFSRLFSKETCTDQKADKIFFLYDQDKEIGTLSEAGELLQLKVLGLGIAGDIGAAVAIELDRKVYAPLHDFSGNCIALIDSSGHLAETYKIDAFGKETCTPASPKNPWRFSSKRQEENLVFFGFRFYDLNLERWLTPDPSGFSDGPNLYAYALNSPLNRLDLFGLTSLETQPRPMVELQIHTFRQAMNLQSTLIQASAIVEGVRIDWYVSCGHWHKIQFSAEELKTGTIDLLDHFAELMPSQEDSVGLISFQSGIRTSNKGLKKMGQSIIDKVPEGTLSFAMNNPSVNIIWDSIRALLERWGFQTSIVRHTSQMMGAIIDTVHKINPKMVWLDVRHSEGGVIGRRAIELLTAEQKQIFKQQFYNISFAPAKKMPTEYALEAYNLYSDKDRVTDRWAHEQDGLTYKVEFLKCISPRSERILGYADHGFLESTSQKGLSDRLEQIRDTRKFYNGNTR